MGDARVIPPAPADRDDTSGQRTLSARHTAVLRLVLPPLWIALAGYAAWQLWSNPEVPLGDRDARAATAVLRWLLLALIAASLVVLFAFVVPLQCVRLAPDGLRVSGYLREIRLPFHAIVRVRQNWLPTFRLITLELRPGAARRRRVIFMPAGRRPVAFWRADYRREDPLVGELRRLAGLTEP